MAHLTRCLVRITQIDKGFISFQNMNAKVLNTINKGQLRVVDELDYTQLSFWIKVDNVMLLVSTSEIYYTVIRELPNGKT